ncbi:MAG TPA: GNAT family N-acetyltransferase [Spirochaetota bacterium]|nr:GNAT family N-acetyltransferase [Spirochaetota bacterium]HPS87248.1 GNAT family N-acetyltransferase [Spirochaetota bacterium]
MSPQISEILNEKELNNFLNIIINSFSTVSDEMGITKETAPTNPAFLTIDRLLDIYKKMKCFGLYYEDLPIGFFGLEESKDSPLMLEKISVLPEFRHRGYGRMILDHTVKYAIEKKFKKISIAIINENKRLKEWYTGYGFYEVRVTAFPHLPFEVCFMEYTIDSGSN